MPETINVYFRRRSRWYGIDRDTPRVANWEMNPLFELPIATGVAGAVGTIARHGDLDALYDHDGALQNLPALAARGQDIKAGILGMQPDDKRKTFIGATAIAPGKSISRVMWRDFGDDVGQVTVIENGVVERTNIGDGGESSPAIESTLPGDWARKTHPLYPHVMQVVEIYDPQAEPKESIQPTSGTLIDGSYQEVYLHPGRVRLIRAGLEILEDCWVLILKDFDEKKGEWAANNGDILHGRLSGLASVGQSERPLYTVSPNPDQLVLLSPVECFQSHITTPQEMNLWKLNTCEWIKTDTIVLAVDPNDTNFLLPTETQFAQLRPGCEVGGVPVYDLVGSRGLRRKAKANAAIECDALGQVTVWDVNQEGTTSTDPCTQDATWRYGDNGNPSWGIIIPCQAGCQVTINPNLSPPPGTPQAGDLFHSPCAVPGDGEQDSTCESIEKECIVDVCNSWGGRNCIPAGAEIEIQYVKNGIWSPIHRRNGWYLAALTAAMCPDETGPHEITGVQALDFCEDAEVTQAITSAINKFGRAGINQDYVLLKRDNTTCDGEIYIVQVLAKCRDLPMPADCGGDGVFLTKNGCVSIDALVLAKCSVESCTEIPIAKPQFGLAAATVSRHTLTVSDCTVTLNRFDKTICVFADGSYSAGTPAGSLTFGTERFVKVDWTIDKDTQGSGSGESCGSPKLTFSTGYALTLENCTSNGDPGSVDLIEVPIVTGINWGECPSHTQAVFALLGAQCSPEVSEEAECEDYACPTESGSG